MRSTWSSGTDRSSGSSTTHEVVPTIDSPRCGTTISPSPDLCIRLITMLQNRPRNASSTPGEGAIGTLVPAMAATFPDHGPGSVDDEIGVELARLASHVVADDGASDHAIVDEQPDHFRVERISAPLAARWRRSARDRRIGSIVPSGTRTAAFSSGFRFGCRRSASAGLRRWAGSRAACSPRPSARGTPGLVRTATNRPSLSSISPGRSASGSCLLDALDRRLAVADA